MGLDNATVKEFANLINPFNKTSGEATVYGRVVGFNEVGGRPKVQLDGSSQIILIRTTVKVKGPKGSPGDPDYYEGDRVLVRIKNHEALIVSNISTQMTTAEGAEDATKQYVSNNGFIYAEKISGEQGDFYTLSADKFTATEITGALGHFITVNADNIITDAINARIADIDTIKASDVAAYEGDFSYLNVDRMLYAKNADMQQAKINKAFVGDLFAKVGLLDRATIVEGHVTGYLDAVEVNASKITAGTLLVNRLYLTRSAEEYDSSATYEINDYSIMTKSYLMANAETFSTNSDYRFNELVKKDNKLYRAKHDITHGDWNSNDWEEITKDCIYKYDGTSWTFIRELDTGETFEYYRLAKSVTQSGNLITGDPVDNINERSITADRIVAKSITTDELDVTQLTAANSTLVKAFTKRLEAENIFVTNQEAVNIIAHSIDSELAELDILNINEELKTQNIHLGEIVFDQPTKPEVMSGNPDYLLGIERETETISAYDSTSLYSEGDYVTHYYSDNNLIPFPFSDGTKTMGGITYTSNIDGSMKINGTATSKPVSQYIYGTVWLPNGEYDVLSNSNGSVPLSARYNKRDPSTGKITEMVAATDSDGNGAILKITNGDNIDTEGVIVTILMQILNGTTINNVTMYPLVSKHLANEEPKWTSYIKGVYKCIKPITTAELWDENKWYYLRDAVSGDQYDFDHVRYTNKIKADELHLGKIFFDQTDKQPTANENPSFFLNIDAYNAGGEVHYGTFPLKIGLGGTGATTAANARANLATPAMVTSSYPALLPTSGSNNWIQIGTSNTEYGLLPSQSGNYASGGHNYLGTSYWYWANLFVHNINGVAVGTSPKFTDTNTWPSKVSQLSNDSEYIYGSGTRAGASSFWGVDQMINIKNGNNASDSMVITVKALSGKANKIFGVSTWSDEKIKTNINPSNVMALEIIQRLIPKEFDYIDAKYGGHVDLGFTAQNVENYIPEAVLECPQSANGEGQDITIKTLDYQRVVPYLIKAIQEQQEQIDELKQEIKELKEEN